MPLLRLGPLALPSPGEVVEWVGDAAAVGARLPGQVDELVTEVTRLVGVLGDVADRVDLLLTRADGIVGRVDGVLDDARRATAGADEVVATARTVTASAVEAVDGALSVTTRAGEAVDGALSITTRAGEAVDGAREITDGAAEIVRAAGATSTSAQELLDLYRPLLERGAPLAGRFVDDLTPEEVDAAIKLVDQLPVLTEHMTTDILPILETLDRVGPDLRELLDVTKEVRQAIAGVPGLGYFTRRGAAKEDDAG